KQLFANLLQRPGKTAAAQYRMKHKNGQWRWMEALSTNLINNQTVSSVVVNYRDITEIKHAEWERERFIVQLKHPLGKASVFSGPLVISAWCPDCRANGSLNKRHV